MEEFGFGGHTCLIYSSSEDLWKSVIPYMKEGLKRGEKVIYVADDNKQEDVKKAILADDPGVFETALSKGDVVILSREETYHQSGVFDPEAMIALIGSLEQEALSQGYKGVRGLGEMTWALEDVPGADKLVEYERQLNEFVKRHKMGIVCLYNQQRFGPEMINLMLRIHPHKV